MHGWAHVGPDTSVQACSESPDSHPLRAQESFQTAVCVYMCIKEINNA